MQVGVVMKRDLGGGGRRKGLELAADERRYIKHSANVEQRNGDGLESMLASREGGP